MYTFTGKTKSFTVYAKACITFKVNNHAKKTNLNVFISLPKVLTYKTTVKVLLNSSTSS